MRFSLVVCAALLHVFFAATVFAQGTGRSLDIQPGARQNAMGAAGVALPGDPSDAVWWNPAALGFAGWYGAQVTRAKLVPGLADDVLYHHAAGAIPLGRGGIGIGLTYLSYGKSEYTDALGNSLGFFTAYELSPSLSAGFRVIPEVAIGATVKYLRIKLGPNSGGPATGVAADLGGLGRMTTGPVTLNAGFAVQNLGPEISFRNEDQSAPLSRNLKAGVAGTVAFPLEPHGFEIGGSVAADYNWSLVTSDFRTWHTGVEVYGAHGRLVRLALRAGHYDDQLDGLQDATYGGGVRIYGLSADVAWTPLVPTLDKRIVKLTFGFHTDALSELASR